MYCQHCGAESTQGLNYCNRCGGNLGPLAQAQEDEVSLAPSTGTVRAVGITLVALVVIGLAIMAGLMVALVQSGVRPEPLVLMMMCGSATILASVFMLTRFWMRMLLGKSGRDAERPRLNPRAANAYDLAAARPFAGALPDTPPQSVTEHTTRTLEHAKRKS